MKILTFFGLNYSKASLIALYFVVLGISYPKKSDQSDIILKAQVAVNHFATKKFYDKNRCNYNRINNMSN